MILFFS